MTDETMKIMIEKVYRKSPIAYNPENILPGKECLIHCECDNEYIILCKDEEQYSKVMHGNIDVKCPNCLRHVKDSISISVHSGGFFNAISRRTHP